MAHEILYVERGDIIYPVKLIVDAKIDSRLSLRAVEQTLTQFGFISPDISDVRGVEGVPRSADMHYAAMIRGDTICQFSPTEVAFSNPITDEEIERIRTEIHALLVTRVEILSGAAEQNASSALINLLQNQRRACVSDMYYASHNAIAALQEYFLLQGRLDHTRINIDELSREASGDESRLGHCSPAVARPIVSVDHLRLLWESDTEDILCHPDLQASKDVRDRQPHRSPYVWLSIMLKRLLTPTDSKPETEPGRRATFLERRHQVRESLHQEVVDLVKQAAQKLDSLELEPLGLGGKNEEVEKDFKKVYTDIRHLLTKELKSDDVEAQHHKSVLALAGFLMFSQIMRLSGDYDSSFEIKIRLQDIVDWTLLSVRLVSLVIAFVRGERISVRSCIEPLPTRCDRRLLGVSEPLEGSRIVASLGGAIRAPGFDLLRTARELHRSRGYSLTQADGRTQRVDHSTEEVTLWKRIPGFTQLVCFITLNHIGLYWIEVADSPFRSTERSSPRRFVNTYYLNLIIDRVFIGGDLLPCLPSGSIVYRAVSESPQLDDEASYAMLLSNLVYGPYVTMHLRRVVDRIFSQKLGENENPAIHHMWVRSRADIESGRFFVSQRLERESSSNPDARRIILVIPMVDLSPRDQERIEENIRRDMTRLPDVDYAIEFLTSEAIDNALFGNTALLEALISTIASRFSENKPTVLLKEMEIEPAYESTDELNAEDSDEFG